MAQGKEYAALLAHKSTLNTTRHIVNAIAGLMQNETAVVAFGLVGLALEFLGFCLLATVSFLMTFIHRTPGGLLSFSGVLIVLATFVLAQLATSGHGVELQYGPAGSVVEDAIYTLGGFLCVLGYARLTWHVIRIIKNRQGGSAAS